MYYVSNQSAQLGEPAAAKLTVLTVKNVSKDLKYRALVLRTFTSLSSAKY